MIMRNDRCQDIAADKSDIPELSRARGCLLSVLDFRQFRQPQAPTSRFRQLID